MEQSAREFFSEYQRANSSSDVSAFASLYADTFMFGGINGAQAVSRADFLKVIPKRKAHLSALGLSQTQLGSVEAVSLGSGYLLVKVAWKFKLQQLSGLGDLDALSTYVLAPGSGDALSIVLQIDHQDLASLIKEQQTT